MSFDFPNAPALNQTFQGYIWDGEKWTSNATLSPPPKPPPSASTQRGYLFGLDMRATTTVTVTPGTAADSTGAVMMNLAAAMTKTVAAWAAGNNGGGLDQGAIANATWYHWYLIYNPTTLAVDVIFSATATPDAGPLMPPGYTLFRRIGSLRFTSSAVWFGFVQNGDEVLYAVSNNDVNNAAVPIPNRVLFAVLVPPGVVVNALLRITCAGVNSGTTFIITSPDESDQAVLITGAGSSMRLPSTSPVDAHAAHFNVRTDTLGRFGIRSATGGAATVYVSTYGYIDRRGKDG